MRLTANENTGEHTCVMLRQLQSNGLTDMETEQNWLLAFADGIAELRHFKYIYL